MTFPVRYWVDLVAFGFFAFEMSQRTQGKDKDKRNENKSLRHGAIVTGLIATALVRVQQRAALQP